MLETLTRLAPKPLARSLKPIERAVLLDLAHGFKYDQIAARQYIGCSQVGAHVTDLHGLFGVSSSAHMVALAHRRGLLPVEPYTRPTLTARRRQLLSLIGAGLLNREIAPLMGIEAISVAPAAVKLYEVMGVRNRPHAVHVGVCTRLIALDDRAVRDV